MTFFENSKTYLKFSCQGFSTAGFRFSTRSCQKEHARKKTPFYATKSITEQEKLPRLPHCVLLASSKVLTTTSMPDSTAWMDNVM